jgi:SAM-dependent methyltransferase
MVAQEARLLEASWSHVAERYHAYWSPRFEPFLRRAVERFEPAEDGALGVPGCGPGDEVLLLARRFPERSIVATDLSPAMTAILRRRVRERGLSRVLVAEDDAAEMSTRARQAGGILSTFVLQLLPNPMAALADWSRALRQRGRISALFWPLLAGDSPFARLGRLLEERGATPRPPWEEMVRDTLAPLGLRLIADERVEEELAHASPEECFRELHESGPLQVHCRRLGREAIDALGKAWLQSHGMERRGSEWVHRATARLWLLERSEPEEQRPPCPHRR